MTWPDTIIFMLPSLLYFISLRPYKFCGSKYKTLCGRCRPFNPPDLDKCPRFQGLFKQVLDHLASSDSTVSLYQSVFEKFREYRMPWDNNYDASIPRIRDILVNAPKFNPLPMDKTNDRYSTYWGMVSTAGRVAPDIQINGNLIRAFEEVAEDSPLFTILAFIVAVTILTELCEYTVKVFVGLIPRIQPYERTLHEWSGRTWEDLVFDRGHVSVMWLKENVGTMNNILGVALQQKKGLGLPREDYQKELSTDVCSSFLASLQSTSLESIKFHDLPDSQRGPEVTFTRLTPLPIRSGCATHELEI